MAEPNVNEIAEKLAHDATSMGSTSEDMRDWVGADIPRVEAAMGVILVEVLTPYMSSIGNILTEQRTNAESRIYNNFLNAIRDVSTCIKDDRPDAEDIAKEKLVQLMKEVCDEKYKNNPNVPTAITIIKKAQPLDDSLRRLHIVIQGITVAKPSAEEHFRTMVDPVLEKTSDLPQKRIKEIIDAALKSVGLARISQDGSLRAQSESLLVPVFTTYPDYVDIIEPRDIEALLKQVKSSRFKSPDTMTEIPPRLHRGPEEHKPDRLPLAQMAYLPIYNVMTAKYRSLLHRIAGRLESDGFTTYENRKFDESIALKLLPERVAILSNTIDTLEKFDDVVRKIEPMNMPTMARLIASKIDRGILEGNAAFFKDALDLYTRYQSSLIHLNSHADAHDAAWHSYNQQLINEAFELCVHRECEKISEQYNLRNNSSAIDVGDFTDYPLHGMLLSPAFETSLARVERDVRPFSWVDDLIRAGAGQYRPEGRGYP